MKLRIKFTKTGVMRFIGHLDMMRFFQKAIRRAGIDIAYSGGYSPHQIMSFAAPLGVGLESLGEYMDIEVHSLNIQGADAQQVPEAEEAADPQEGADAQQAADPQKGADAQQVTDPKEVMDPQKVRRGLTRIKKCLNEVMVPGIEVLSVIWLGDHEKNAMASVAAAAYRVRFREGKEPDGDWTSQFNDWISQEEIPMTKKTKKGETVFDLKSTLFSVRAEADQTVHMLLNAGSCGNVKPSFVMDAFMDFTHREPEEHFYAILREETFTEKERENKVQLIPLDAVGKEVG